MLLQKNVYAVNLSFVDSHPYKKFDVYVHVLSFLAQWLKRLLRWLVNCMDEAY